MMHWGLWSYEGESHDRHRFSVCADTCGVDKNGFIDAELDDSEHKCIAMVYGSTEFEALDNARIISASKDLLEFCEKISDELKALNPEYHDELSKILKKARGS